MVFECADAAMIADDPSVQRRPHRMVAQMRS